MAVIRNINERYGYRVTFEDVTVEEAAAKMQWSIRQCGPEYADIVVEPSDYEVVDDRSQEEIDFAEYVEWMEG